MKNSTAEELLKEKIIANIRMELLRDTTQDNCFCDECGHSRYECDCLAHNQALADVIKLIEEL